MINSILKLLGIHKGSTDSIQTEEEIVKYLIAGLGNIGAEYAETRHNVGFKVLDLIADQKAVGFKNDTLADIAEIKHKGRTLVLIKPTTYMNRSGKAVKYWMEKHKIPRENVLVVLDDLHLEFGTLRLRDKGSDAGHNGLKDIDQNLGGNNYSRLRIGIGNDFRQGQQVDYVLGRWSADELKCLGTILEKSAEAVLSFASIGSKFTMEKYNKSFLPKE